MRITPIIRDYITKEVKESFSMTAAELYYRDFQEQCDQIQKDAMQVGKDAALDFINDHLEYHGMEDLDLEIIDTLSCRTIYQISTQKTEIHNEARKAAQSREKKIKETKDAIFLQCELGAKKEHLAAIISEAIKEGRNER